MTSIQMSAQLQDSHILNVKQQRKHFVCDSPKSLQLRQERISSLTYSEELKHHKFERSS